MDGLPGSQILAHVTTRYTVRNIAQLLTGEVEADGRLKIKFQNM